MIANKKPWGYECLAFQNENVAVWHLFIEPGEETSLHCHPNKKTGLVVLDGTAEISFLSGKQELKPLSKIMIRHGVFHRTKNIDNEVLQLFEIETPPNKADLVRIKDKYSRSTNYKIEDTLEIDQKYTWNFKRTPHFVDISSQLKNKTGSLIYEARYINLVNPKTFKHLREHIFANKAIYMITNGGVYTDNICVCGPGDTVYGDVLTFLSNEFSLREDTQAIVIY